MKQALEMKSGFEFYITTYTANCQLRFQHSCMTDHIFRTSSYKQEPRFRRPTTVRLSELMGHAIPRNRIPPGLSRVHILLVKATDCSRSFRRRSWGGRVIESRVSHRARPLPASVGIRLKIVPFFLLRIHQSQWSQSTSSCCSRKGSRANMHGTSLWRSRLCWRSNCDRIGWRQRANC